MTEADGILHELQVCEARFHCPQPDATRAELEAMIADGFFEIGASGHRHNRLHALDVLQQRQAAPGPDSWRTGDVACQQVGSSTWLLTYVLEQRGRVTRRATLWRRTARGWSALYHQGTLVADS